MLKKELLISISIILFYLICCYIITNDNKLNLINISTNNTILKGSKPIERPIAKIKIKQLNIDNNIYSINSSSNSVDKNVSILKESIMPDKKDSIVFLAAHSGTSKVSYFKYLDKLKVGEKILFYYDHKQYTYKIIDKYELDKNGYIGVNKRNDKQLILTTCSPNHKNKQLIIDSILIKTDS